MGIMNKPTPTWVATKRSIVEDVEVAMDDLGYGVQKAAEVVVSDSDYVSEDQEARMIEEVVEKVQSA